MMQLVEDKMLKLDRICREANVMIVFARSYGLTGLVRVSVKVRLKSFDFCAVNGFTCSIQNAIMNGSWYYCLWNSNSRSSGQHLRYVLIRTMC